MLKLETSFKLSFGCNVINEEKATKHILQAINLSWNEGHFFFSLSLSKTDLSITTLGYNIPAVECDIS